MFRIKQDQKERDALDERWDQINAELKAEKKDYEKPPLPFVSDACIRDFNLIYFKVYDKVKAVEM